MAMAAGGALLMLYAGPGPDLHYYFPNQNLLAGGLLVPALLLCATRLTRPKASPWLIAPVLLFAAGIFCSGSRGALLGLGAGAAWLLFRLSKEAPKKAMVLALGFASLAAVMLWAPGSILAQRLERQQDAGTSDPRFNFRWQIWEATARAANERPVHGWGLGSYSRLMEGRELRLPPGVQRLGLDHAHNSWLELAAELGWPAFLAALCLAMAAYWRWARQGGAGAGLESAILALLAHAVVDYEYSTPFLLWVGTFLLAARLPSASAQAVGPAAWRLHLALAASVLFAASLAVSMEKSQAQKYMDCQGQGFRGLSALSPWDAGAAARQAMLDASCFDSGRDPKGLARAVRELSMAIERDPAHRPARLVYAGLLAAAAEELDESALVRMGDLVAGYAALTLQQPGLSAAEKFTLLSSREKAAVLMKSGI
jgi:hypothetical protein